MTKIMIDLPDNLDKKITIAKRVLGFDNKQQVIKYYTELGYHEDKETKQEIKKLTE